MLQVNNISKSYHTAGLSQTALDDVSIAFRDSEFAAILGPSGSGKTTLLNIIGGLDRYDSGDLIIDGISTKHYKPSDWDTFRNNRIGFVFQSYNLIAHQSVLSNVELALTLSGVEKSERKQKALAVLDKVGLAEHVQKKPNQLSGGQMQRVAIARALINDPEILLADEPTGALDSQTSVEIMELLGEIAQDRLVIMVTHNPELADTYANRIVTLRDGKILDDTNAYSPTDFDMQKVSKKKIRRASMKFATALSLSFNNLMSKKGRTIMTAFAGSIGIIGIASILALSNGVNAYISKVEEDTLTSYPVTISKSGFDMSSLVGISTDDSTGDSSSGNEVNDGDVMDSTVGQVQVVNNMVSKMKNNDLATLKSHIESGDGQKIRDNASLIQYDYNISPIIYVKGKTDSKYRKANPDESLTSLGMGSTEYTNSTLSTMMSTNVFQKLTDVDLVKDSYDLKYGDWPKEKDECLLVLTESGQVLDYTLYQLGLRDFNEYKELVQSVVEEKETKVELDSVEHTYRELLSTDMKVVVGADLYSKDETYGVWVDKSEDEAFLNDVLNNKSMNLKISGIVQKKSGVNSNTLQGGCIYYTQNLILDSINKSKNSQIVQEQKSNKEKDVISGKDFKDTSASSSFDLSNIIGIDEDAFSAAFKFDTNALTLNLDSIQTSFSAEDLGKSLPQVDTSQLNEAITSSAGNPIDENGMKKLLVALLNDYTKKASSYSSVEQYLTSTDASKIYAEYAPEMINENYSKNISNSIISFMNQYLESALNAMAAQMAQSMQSTMSALTSQIQTNMASAMSVDRDAISKAFKVNMTQDELQGAILAMVKGGTTSYDSNMQKFGYADLDTPTSINIYAKNFDSKQNIKDALDQYSSDMKSQGEEDKTVSYTDIVGTMMSGVRTIIDVISYLLIAFVSISLVVSSIMIGIITYVSVLERTKEIGILRAIGASRKNISQVFNAETIIEGLIAGLFGVGVTMLLCIPASAIVEALTKVPNLATLPIAGAIILVCISVFLTFIAGLIPAASASRKDPVIALRTE